MTLGALPLIEAALAFAREGVVTGASGRNWAAYGAEVAWPADAPAWMQALASDPQTSGGLLVSCRPDAVDAVLAEFQRAGFAEAAVIGQLAAPSHGEAPKLHFDHA